MALANFRTFGFFPKTSQGPWDAFGSSIVANVGTLASIGTHVPAVRSCGQGHAPPKSPETGVCRLISGS